MVSIDTTIHESKSDEIIASVLQKYTQDLYPELERVHLGESRGQIRRERQEGRSVGFLTREVATSPVATLHHQVRRG